MFRILISIFFFLSPLFELHAQSKAFNLMLDQLLDESVEQVDVQSFQEISKNNKVHILDAREKEEFEVSHIEGAEYIGYERFKNSSVKSISKSDTILVYCSVGYRSEKIGERLKKMGFENVYNLRGGIFQWKNEGKETLNSNNQTTDSVHAYSPEWGIWLNEGIKVYE